MRRTFRIVAAFAVCALLVPAVPARAGGGCHEDVTQGASVRVVLKQACFAPAVTWVAPGATVTWTNLDPGLHTVFGSGFGINSGDMVEGASYSLTFTNTGVFPYLCSYHPGMVGAVVVGRPSAPTANGPAPTANDGRAGALTGPEQEAFSSPAAALDAPGDTTSVGARTKQDSGSPAGIAAVAAIAAAAVGFTIGRRRRARV